jgi:LytS/YehU family sensor histidine kinase
MRDDRPLRIDIVSKIEDNMAMITVKDNGIGIAADVQPHVMDANREHAGIAMTNVDERLRSVFGATAGLEVQSELGVGTSVILRLGPWLPRPDPPAAPSPTQQIPVRHRPIEVVEDDTSNNS